MLSGLKEWRRGEDEATTYRRGRCRRACLATSRSTVSKGTPPGSVIPRSMSDFSRGLWASRKASRSVCSPSEAKAEYGLPFFVVAIVMRDAVAYVNLLHWRLLLPRSSLWSADGGQKHTGPLGHTPRGSVHQQGRSQKRSETTHAGWPSRPIL